jgi:hypothetical protein
MSKTHDSITNSARDLLPELYYEAARLNPKICVLSALIEKRKKLNEKKRKEEDEKRKKEEKKRNLDPAIFLEYFQRVTPEILKGLHGEKWDLEKAGFSKVLPIENNSNRAQEEYLFLQGAFYDHIRQFGGIINRYCRKKTEVQFAPQLIAFVMMHPGFPEKAWGEDCSKDSMEQFFHFSDDGPVPALRELTDDSQKNLDDIRKNLNDFNACGRKLSLEQVTIDWSYSNQEIIDAFTDHITQSRQRRVSCAQPNQDASKATLGQTGSYYRSIKLGFSPGAMLAMLDPIREIYKDKPDLWENIIKNSSHDPNKPFESYQAPTGNPPKSIKAIRTALSHIGIKEGSNYTSGAKNIDSFIHVIQTGFNLPSATFTKSSDARYLTPTSTF